MIAVHTTLDPYALLRLCLQIEASAYRQRVVHWGPRTLDLDLLFYDDVHIDDPDERKAETDNYADDWMDYGVHPRL